MIRRNRSTINRPAPSPLVILIGAGLFLAVAALILWHRPSASNPQQTTAHRASLSPAVAKLSQPKMSPRAVEVPASGSLRRANVTIKGSLPHSFRRVMKRKDSTFLSALSARMLIWSMNIRRDMRRGDKLQVLYTPTEGQSKFVIHALVYKSRKLRKTFRFFRYKANGNAFAKYYSADGIEQEQRLRNSPIHRYEQITSIPKMRPRHKGVDFKAPVGAKIYLPWRARVIRTTWNFRYNGNCAEVEFIGKRWRRRRVRGLFLHLKQLSPAVKRGRILRAGTVIGESGNTGRSTAPHLHYQLQTRRGRVIYPFNFHRTYRARLQGAELDRFQATTRKLLQKLR